MTEKHCESVNECANGELCAMLKNSAGLTLVGCSHFKPKQPMTNEERLRSADTRGLAKELALLVLYDMPLYDRLHNVFEGGESAVIDECEKWLKEEHQ